MQIIQVRVRCYSDVHVLLSVWMCDHGLRPVCLRNGGSHLSINIREPTRAGSGTVMQADSSTPSPACPPRHSIDAPLFAYKTSHPNAYLSLFTFALALFLLPFGFVPLSPLA